MGGGGARGSKWTAPSVLDRLFLYESRLSLFRATIVSFPLGWYCFSVLRKVVNLQGSTDMVLPEWSSVELFDFSRVKHIKR